MTIVGLRIFRQSIHFSITQVLVADHMHWRTGVDNKFSFLRFKIWCRQAPIFRRWEEYLALATLSPLETDNQILERWGYADEVHLGKKIRANPSEGFWSRILVWLAIAFVNFTRWIGLCMSVLFRRIDFGGVMSWNTQPNCRASDDRRWEELRSNFLSLFLQGFPSLSWP